MDPVIKDRWFSLPLVEQMMNIGNEVKRAIRFDDHHEKRDPFLNKAIFYTDLTMEDPKNRKVIPELAISKQLLEEYKRGELLECSKEQITKYYGDFRFLLKNNTYRA